MIKIADRERERDESKWKRMEKRILWEDGEVMIAPFLVLRLYFFQIIFLCNILIKSINCIHN